MASQAATAARNLLTQAKREFGAAAAAGSAQAAEIIRQYEEKYEQAAATATANGVTRERGISVMPPRSAEITRLRSVVKYEALDASETRREFDRLNGALTKLGEDVDYTVDRIVPILSDVQTLTSQRGAARKRVLKEAKLPEWTPFLQKYADRFGIGIRQLQRKIAAYRGTGSKKEPKERSAPKPKAESDIEAEVRRRLVPVVETGERYIRILEDHVSTLALTEDQRYALRLPCEAWRKILRYVRGLKTEQKEQEAA